MNCVHSHVAPEKTVNPVQRIITDSETQLPLTRILKKLFGDKPFDVKIFETNRKGHFRLMVPVACRKKCDRLV